jgi:nicotinamidase/pyrazinamidase
VQQAFDLIVASRDWHPRDHGSFAASHPGKKVGDVIDLHGLPQILWPVHCVQNTPGADFVPGLETSRIERVFLKGTDKEIDSYSAFFDNGHRKSTGMGEYLKGRGVRDVYICGLATDYCVNFTALDAAKLGFNVHLIEDASRGVNLKPDDSANALEAIRRAGGADYPQRGARGSGGIVACFSRSPSVMRTDRGSSTATRTRSARTTR